MLLLLLSCAADCPPGSVLGDDGLCYLTEAADTGASTCAELTWASAGQPYLLTYCTGCHSAGVTGEWRRGAPSGTDFETLAGARTWQDRIAARIAEGTMPPGGGAPADQTERLLAWIDCGASGTEAPLPAGQAAPTGDAMELGVYAESDAGELVVVRQVEQGTRDFGTVWSTERYTVSGAEAWWHGYTLLDADGESLRAVSFYPEIPLTESGTLAVEADVEEGGAAATEDWSVTVDIRDDAAPLDGREATWDFTEVLVVAGAEEHGWHLSESRGQVARWVILDEEQAFSALQIGESFTDGQGFPLSAESRWLERIVAPGGWSL